MIVLTINPTIHQVKRLLEELIEKKAWFRFDNHLLSYYAQIEILEVKRYTFDVLKPYGKSFMIDFKGFDGELHQIYIHSNDVTAFEVWSKT
jgi:hypothetical protein